MDEFREGTIPLTVFRDRKYVREEGQGKILGRWGVHPSSRGSMYQVTELTTGFYVEGYLSEESAMELAKRLYALGPIPLSVDASMKTLFEDSEQRKALAEVIRKFNDGCDESDVLYTDDEDE